MILNQQLLRRAWDALDTYKQAYPESWFEEDEQLLNDLMAADMKLSGVKEKNITPYCGHEETIVKGSLVHCKKCNHCFGVD